MFGRGAHGRELRQPMAPGVPGGPGQIPVAGPPAQMGMGCGRMPAPMCAHGAMTGMQHLGTLPSIEVKEKANMIQEVTAMLGVEVDMANHYDVLDLAGNRLFHAAERTNCCTRQMQNGCCHDCAAWEVDVFYTPPHALHQTFVKLKRPCQFSCCCCWRPIAHVIDQSTNQKLGSFRDPCTCCKLQFGIRDARDQEILRVNGGCCCCQPGFWCPLPCGPCSEVRFDVEDVATGQQVAKVAKQVPGCFTWFVAPDIDNYKVDFEQVQTPEWKAMLVAVTIFMDFRWFNTNRNQEEASRRLGEQ